MLAHVFNQILTNQSIRSPKTHFNAKCKGNLWYQPQKSRIGRTIIVTSSSSAVVPLLLNNVVRSVQINKQWRDWFDRLTIRKHCCCLWWISTYVILPLVAVVASSSVLCWRQTQLASWPLLIILIDNIDPSEVQYVLPFPRITVTGFAHCLEQTDETKRTQFPVTSLF